MQDTKAAAFKNNGYYEVIEGYDLDCGKIYALDNIFDEVLLEKEKKAVYETNAAKRKATNKYYRMDSVGEYDFAQNHEKSPNILLFTKHKK